MKGIIVEYWRWFVALLSFVLAAVASAHAILWKRDNRAVIGWVGLVWLSPVFGAVLYFVFGINRIRRKAVSMKIRHARARNRNKPGNKNDGPERESLLLERADLAGLANIGQVLSKWSVAHGNRVVPLVNGDEAYPAMLSAIANAEHSIAFQVYIFDSDRVGDEFFDALVAARYRGVAVRVLIDDVGSRYGSPNIVGRLKDAGVNAISFLPTRFPQIRAANLRNHRKILVVDGKIGFTGGTNIREGHQLSLRPKEPVQCLHFSVEGPVVSQLLEVFAIDWAFSTGESLDGEIWFPPLEIKGTTWARGIAHGPDEDFLKMSNTIAGALSVARQSVRIVTPYFLPDSALIHALQVAALRGVDVEILIPERCNIRLVQWAMSAQLWQVLEKGCRVFYTPPPFDHTKLMIVDDTWSLIGSTNWDARSLRLNFEFNLECYDSTLARQLTALFGKKKAAARETTLDEVDARTIQVRLRDGLARLLTPYL